MKCEKCGGKGRLWIYAEHIDDDVIEKCPDCHGSGEQPEAVGVKLTMEEKENKGGTNMKCKYYTGKINWNTTDKPYCEKIRNTLEWYDCFLCRIKTLISKIKNTESR